MYLHRDIRGCCLVELHIDVLQPTHRKAGCCNVNVVFSDWQVIEAVEAIRACFCRRLDTCSRIRNFDHGVWNGGATRVDHSSDNVAVDGLRGYGKLETSQQEQ